MTSCDDVITPEMMSKHFFFKILALSFNFHPESSKSAKNCDLQQFFHGIEAKSPHIFVTIFQRVFKIWFLVIIFGFCYYYEFLKAYYVYF